MVGEIKKKSLKLLLRHQMRGLNILNETPTMHQEVSFLFLFLFHANPHLDPNLAEATKLVLYKKRAAVTSFSRSRKTFHDQKAPKPH